MNSDKKIVNSNVQIQTSGTAESGPVKVNFSQSGGNISFNIRGLFAVLVSLITTMVPFALIVFQIIYLRRTEYSNSFNMQEKLQTYIFYGAVKVLTILFVTFIAHSFYIFIFNGNVISKYVVLILLFAGVLGSIFLVNKFIPGSAMSESTTRNLVESSLYAIIITMFSYLALDNSLCIYDSKRCEKKN
jgi:hypothetical protein